jgi:hypothetical protein
VPAGKLRLGILPEGVAPESPAGQRTIALDQVEVPPGGEIERVFQALHRTLTLRILEADGTPARERWIQSSLMTEVQPDADGLVRIDPAPAQAIYVSTLPKGMNQARRMEAAGAGQALMIVLATALRMPEGEKHATVELRIPAGK